MKKFVYRFEKLLTIRKHTEKQWEIKLAEIAGVCASLENQIHTLSRRKLDMFGKRFTPGNFNTHALLSADMYIRKLDYEIVRTQNHLDEKRQIYNQIHKEYVEASKQRKILDNLKDKKQGNHKKEAERLSVKIIDDISSTRFGRLD